MRDIVQNHIFTLLTLVAMEPPSTLVSEAVRNEKVKVLDAIRPMSPEQVIQNAVWGQYGDGYVGGTKVPTYRAEPRVAPRSMTETYAAVKLFVENWRWAGVPFYIRSGKRLARRDTQISIQFRRPPLLLFEKAGVESIDPNRLERYSPRSCRPAARPSPQPPSGSLGPFATASPDPTNLAWMVDGARVVQRLGLAAVALLNDLEASAWALEVLAPEDAAVLSCLGRDVPRAQAPSEHRAAVLHNVDAHPRVRKREHGYRLALRLRCAAHIA